MTVRSLIHSRSRFLEAAQLCAKAGLERGLVIDLALAGRVPLSEIAAIYGVSRQAIHIFQKRRLERMRKND